MQTRPHWPDTVRVVAGVSAGIPSFGAHLGLASEGMIGPSQWEPGVSFSPIVGLSSDWFINAFQKEFGTVRDYISAGAYASVLIAAECIRHAGSVDGSIDNDALRRAASQLNCNTFYGRFQIDPPTGKQLKHRILLIRWHDSGNDAAGRVNFSMQCAAEDESGGSVIIKRRCPWAVSTLGQGQQQTKVASPLNILPCVN